MLWLVSMSVVLAGPADRLVFEPAPMPPPVGAPYSVSPRAWINGREAPVPFQELLRVGDQPGSSPAPFGQLHTVGGQPFPSGRAPFTDLCNQLDYTTLQEAHGKLWMWSHFECVRGAIYLTELEQDPNTGSLRAVHTQPVDRALDAQGGVFAPCAGDLTPWGTLLSSEEYEPDARYWDSEKSEMTDEYWFSSSLSHLYGAFEHPRDAHPYRFGWVPEFAVQDAQGTVAAEKHYAMGRFSHEIARVMPDGRTVLQSDDGWGVGLYLFVADRPADLSSGTLYAAQWTLHDRRSVGQGRVDWISLGHGSDADIAPLLRLAPPVRFDELFDRAELLDTGRCPQSHTATHTFGVTECLRLASASERVPDPALAASRLETRRYAALLGATTEWKKGEGLASSPSGDAVYFAISDVSGTMLAGDPATAAPDTIRLPENRCGVVYEGHTSGGQTDTRGVAIDSDFVPWELHGVVAGIQKHPTECDPRSIANPDNLTWMGPYGLLAIAEDTRRAPDGLWVWDRQLDSLTRILLAPPEAEVAGLSMVPDLRGHAYLTFTLQSPGSHRADAQPFDPALRGQPFGSVPDDHRSVVGVLGPLPTASAP